jgi:hypothetical protein
MCRMSATRSEGAWRESVQELDMKRAKLFGFALAASLIMPTGLLGGDTDGSTQGDGGEAPANTSLLHVWRVSLQPDQATLAAGKGPFSDNFLFEDDNFMTAEAFGALGFGRSEYTVTAVEGATLGFSSTISNGEQGTLVWNGVVQGSRVMGTLVWTKPDGSTGTYNFSGEPLE